MNYRHSWAGAGLSAEPIERVSNLWIAPTTIVVHVHPQPEGHLLATSIDMPGLIVEGDTLSEIMEEVESVAPVIWELDCGTQFEARISYVQHSRP